MTENLLAPVAQLTLPDAGALTTKAQQALAFIEQFAIVDHETYELAGDELRAIKTRQGQLEVERTKITGPLNAALRGVNALFGGPGKVLEQAEVALKGKMSAYLQEQERIAAEQRRAAEEAAAAERQRQAAEAAAKMQEAQQQQQLALDAAATGDLATAAIAQTNAARAQDEATAAAVAAQVITAPVATVPPPQAAGISSAKKIDFEVIDLLALIRHVAERPELVNLLAADSTRLRAYVRGVGLACTLPGVRVFEDKVIRARAAA